MGSTPCTGKSLGTAADDLASIHVGSGEPNGKNQINKEASKRVWIAKEEEALMEVVKMAIASGLKSENGWKPNYKSYLKTELHKLLPGTDIQVQPHILSKLKQWSREYACISSIKDKSGVGWDAVEKRVLCSQEMWNSHAQAHNGMMKKKNYNWPFYDDWEYVFGKDRANGKGATDVREAAKRFIPDIIKKANKKTVGEEDFACSDEQWYDGDDGASSASNTKKAKTTTTGTLPSIDEGFVSAITQIFTKERDSEDSTNILRSKINEALIPIGLSDKDRMMLGRRMTHNDKLLHYFFSLNDADREICARQELEEIGSYRPTYD